MSAHASARPPCIVAFPFAGGTAYSYARIAQALPSGTTLKTLEPPGHGRRLSEAPLRSIAAMAADLRPQVLAAARGEPFVLFGHSMGAYIALAMLDALQAHGDGLPERLVLSGAAPPHHRPVFASAGLPRAEFLGRVAGLGALPREVLEQDEIMELFEPVLRADFDATDAFDDSHRRSAGMPVDVLAGAADAITRGRAHHWSDCFARPPHVREWPGGHFFIYEHARDVAAAIAEPAPTRVDGAARPD